MSPSEREPLIRPSGILPRHATHHRLLGGWAAGVLLNGSQRRFAIWDRDDVIHFSLPLESWRWAARDYRAGNRRGWVDAWLGRDRV